MQFYASLSVLGSTVADTNVLQQTIQIQCHELLFFIPSQIQQNSSFSPKPPIYSTLQRRLRKQSAGNIERSMSQQHPDHQESMRRKSFANCQEDSKDGNLARPRSYADLVIREEDNSCFNCERTDGGGMMLEDGHGNGEVDRIIREWKRQVQQQVRGR